MILNIQFKTQEHSFLQVEHSRGGMEDEQEDEETEEEEAQKKKKKKPENINRVKRHAMVYGEKPTNEMLCTLTTQQ